MHVDANEVSQVTLFISQDHIRLFEHAIITLKCGFGWY